jgi:Flp pilus assembly pilin Flp
MTGAQALVRHLRSERGQDTLEWAMLGGVVAIAILGAYLILGGAINALLGGVSACVDFDGVTPCLPGGIF